MQLQRLWALCLVLAAPAIGFLVSKMFFNNEASFLSKASVITGIAGIALIVLIAIAGEIARINRIMLLILFRPGLHITAFWLMGLICMHAVIIILSVYALESALMGMIHIGIILAISLVSLGGVLAMGNGMFGLIQEAEIAVVGRTISRQEAPDLWNAVEESARRLGALVPQYLVIGLDPTFFVTEANVVLTNQRLVGRTLYSRDPRKLRPN
jgi:hypothetical protein